MRLTVATVALVACAASPAVKPAVYEAELTECTAKSSTKAESIACENSVRAKYGRPPRDAGGDQ